MNRLSYPSDLEAYVRIEKVLADQAYKGELGEIIEQIHHCVLEVTKKLGESFAPAPYRWVTVEVKDVSARLKLVYESTLRQPIQRTSQLR